MKARLLLLKQLYLRRFVGERFTTFVRPRSKREAIFAANDLDSVIKNCQLCELGKASKTRHIGIIKPHSPLVFITLKPILAHTKSSEMLENIAKKVFGVESFSAISLIKCECAAEDKIPQKSLEICAKYAKTQVSQLSPALVILFGEKVAQIVLETSETGESLPRGRILQKNLPAHNNHAAANFAAFPAPAAAQSPAPPAAAVVSQSPAAFKNPAPPNAAMNPAQTPAQTGFLVTHSIAELLRKPEAKKSAHRDFLAAKTQLKF